LTDEVLVRLSVWSEVQIVQLMPVHPKTPSSLASPKCRLVLPFWYWLTQAVLEKRPLNGCNSSVVADEMVLTAKPEKLDLSIFSYKTIYTVSKKNKTPNSCS